VSPANNFDLQQLRAELRSMTDVELRTFLRAASEACNSGSDLNIKHVVRLQEATAEWRRRKNPKTPDHTK
jgi:hypothetical protein